MNCRRFLDFGAAAGDGLRPRQPQHLDRNAAGLGAAVADTIFAAVGALAISLVGNFLNTEQSWFKLGAGIFLIIFGLYLARKPALTPENV